MLSFDEARSRLLADVPRLAAERVPLVASLGRVLAEPLVAALPWPPFDGSAMDGYAVRTSDFDGDGPWTLPVVGESRTGRAPGELAPGATCRIFTGAIVPTGADAVVMQENVVREGDAARFVERPKRGAHIRRTGEDLRKGETVLAPGARMTPARIGLAASLDRAEVVVSRRPVVTILSTGDELRAPGSASRDASIPESNGVALAAFAMQAGAIARIAPIVGDDEAETVRAVEDALATTDVLVTVGGVSVGEHDVVRPALERAGVTIDFWKVAIKPGKPIAIGRRGATYVLGLPGNPVSALVTFGVFGMPLLRAMQRDASPVPPLLRARLSAEISRPTGRLELSRASLARGEDLPVATLLSNQASGALVGLARADALAFLPADAAHLERGAIVDVLRLEDA